jgi:hypothetical protein
LIDLLIRNLLDRLVLALAMRALDVDGLFLNQPRRFVDTFIERVMPLT